MKTQRTLLKTIKEISKLFPVLLVTGPRQVGKTTLFEMYSSTYKSQSKSKMPLFISLDNLEVRAFAQNDPNAFFRRYKPPIIIDEIQYAPQLLTQIKMIVDRTQKTNLFWLTGSQKFTLMKSIQESLAGRMAILDLLGFSQAEISGCAFRVKPFLPTPRWIKFAAKNKSQYNLMELYRRIWLGSFPRLHHRILSSKSKTSLKERNIFYDAYIRTYLQRDVKDILNVTDMSIFLVFLRVVAARTGQILNYSDIARDVGVDHKTIKAWISVLETSGLLYLLYPYYRNITNRMIKAPKIYFLDTGLCCYLTKWPDYKTLESGAMAGCILETYIFTEIVKSYWHNGLNPYFYYYRDKDQKEIDLLIEDGGSLYPIDFKKTATPSYLSTQHFKLLNKLDKKIGPCGVVCLVNQDKLLLENITAIPVQYL